MATTSPAINLYTSLLSESEDAAHLAMRADCYFKLEDYASCLDDAKRVIALDEDNCITSAVLGGQAATKLEKYEDAYHCYKAGIKAQPGHPDVVSGLRTLKNLILKDMDKKGSECEEKGYNALDFCSQEVYPGDDELFTNEIEILSKMYKIQAETLSPSPKDPKIMEQAANAALSGHKCMTEGKWSDAVKLFSVALDLDPSNHILRRLRAEVHFMRDDAISCLRDLWLIPKMSRMADAWKLGGKILWQLELLVVAEFWFRKATQLSQGKDQEAKVLFQKARVTRLYGPLTLDFPVKVDFTEYGRAIFAKENIKAGDMVFSDIPIVFGEVFDTSKKDNIPFCEHCAASLLTPRDYFKSSFSTFDPGMRNLVEKYWPDSKTIFCKKCQYVRYCSEKCRDASWDQYHHVICPSRNKAAKKLFEVCANLGLEELEGGRKNILWSGHFSPLLMARIWATIASSAKKLMKESGDNIPTKEQWAKAKSPFRKFIAYGNIGIQKELTFIHDVMKGVFKDCGDGVTYDIDEREFKGRYFQAVCNLQVFSSPITPYHKFLEALGEVEPTDETFRLLKLLKHKPPSTNVCGMFPLHACLNHSCLNNVEVTDGDVGGVGGVHVFAKRDIKEGEEIFTTYIDTSMPRKLRRAWLFKSFNFLVPV
ncbi:hypothetical protein FSP39_021265 [Pinctada imbricata]|uniref:Uncharacterized protein n=1 Tax=Pinctada imbricata TaxID=66713 RepID=A0AA89BL64_PINIB|nr:hypothetical protein FSP39_021265 [Pinctada imbricata]